MTILMFVSLDSLRGWQLFVRGQSGVGGTWDNGNRPAVRIETQLNYRPIFLVAMQHNLWYEG